MNDLQIFNNPEFGAIRSIEIEGEPWFVGADIARALGYKKPQQAISKNVDEDDSLLRGVTDNLGRIQQTKIINESGVYSLIILSELSSAKKFKRWVTSEVLPSIRKHGMYARDELLDNPDLLIEVATKLKQEREEKLFLQSQNKQLAQTIRRQKPKVAFYDEVVESDSVCEVGEVAKLLSRYGLGRNNLFKVLRENKILMYDNEPYQKYVNEGWFKLIESKYYDNGEVKVSTKTVVFQRGVDGIRRLLEKLGYAER